MKNLLKLKFITCLALLSPYALSTDVMPSSVSGINPVLDDVVAPGLKGIKVTASCYGTNNRYTSNPISGDSNLYITIQTDNDSAAGTDSFLIRFPSAITKKTSQASSSCGYMKISSSEASDISKHIDLLREQTSRKYTSIVDCSSNQVMAKIPGFSMTGLDNRNIKVRTYQDFGRPRDKASYSGYNGYTGRGTKTEVKVVNTNDTLNNSKNLIAIITKYAGQDGFCGGYHSPLMVFFNSKRPTFKNQNNFIDKDFKTYWVEREHPGYFLISRPSKGKSVTIKNLFGDNKGFTNGFESLKKYDSNDDMIIDRKDRFFKELALWKDLNGDGKSSPKEIISLSKLGLKSLPLKYNKSYSYDYGVYASTFGRVKVGSSIVVEDVYFREVD